MQQSQRCAFSATAAEKSASGECYVINPDGQRVIPASRRPDGTFRKERVVRAGYLPAEEQKKYESKGLQFRRRLEQRAAAPDGGVPGALFVVPSRNSNGTDPSSPPGAQFLPATKAGKSGRRNRKKKSEISSIPESLRPSLETMTDDLKKLLRIAHQNTAKILTSNHRISQLVHSEDGISESPEGQPSQTRTTAGGISEEQKKLRNLRKKLNEILKLEKETTDKNLLSAPQLEKLSRKAQIESEIAKISANQCEQPEKSQ